METGMRGAVSANALPCLPATGAWHAPVTASKEELSSDSFAVLHAGQDTPAAPAPVLLRWEQSYTGNRSAGSAWRRAFTPSPAGFLRRNRPCHSDDRAPDQQTDHINEQTDVAVSQIVDSDALDACCL